MQQKETIVRNLNEMIQLDINVVESYVEALKNIDLPDMCNSIDCFRHDHLSHIEALSSILTRLGENPPQLVKVVEELLNEVDGDKAVSSLPGTLGALKLIEDNESMILQLYKKALDWDLDPHLKELIRKNYEDEKRHLNFIQENLKAIGQ